MARYAKRVAHYGTTIFSEINDLAQKHQAINLGQGRPDFDGDASIIRAATEAMLDGRANQYAPGIGIAPLRQKVAEHTRDFYHLDVNPDSEVMITVGASEGMFAAIMGVVNEGDEVILLEPYFDIYLPAVEWAGGTPVYVPMHPPEWRFDVDALRAAFSEKTSAIVLNTPHNPTGRVLSREELEVIAALCHEYDVVCIADEVYEHLTFDGHQHIPIATLPGMFERTITVSSAAKTFSVTGWKVGWAFGHADLITGLWRIRQNVSFAVNHAGQYGVLHALGLDKSYYEDLRTLYLGKRQILWDALSQAGLRASQPEGTFFIMADFSDVFAGDDVAFTKHLIEQVGVACIPPSAFFSPQHRHLAQNHVRFAYCKDDDALYAAAERLAKLGG